MTEIYCEKIKQITITNYIKIGDVLVVGQQCTINSNNPQDISFSSWTNDKALYKENRDCIREQIAKFEDECYVEQEALFAENNDTAKITVEEQA